MGRRKSTKCKLKIMKPHTMMITRVKYNKKKLTNYRKTLS